MAYGLTKSLDLEKDSSQYASISDASQTGLDLSGDFTLEGWVKVESQPGLNKKMVIVNKASTNGSFSFMFVYENNGGTKGLRFTFNNGGASQRIKAQTLTNGTWYHIAATNDTSGNFQFVVDDVSLGTQTAIPAMDNSTSAFSFGYGVEFFDSDEIYFDGELSLWRAWSVARTPTEIADNKCEVLGATTGLEGEWKFDNGYTDNSGNGNDLTATNSPVFVSDVPGTCGSVPSGSTSDMFLVM